MRKLILSFMSVLAIFTILMLAGCGSGAIGGVLSKCIDYDAKEDALHTASYVEKGDTKYEDTCLTENTLTEYECRDGKPVQVQYNCFEKFQTRCFNGECG